MVVDRRDILVDHPTFLQNIRYFFDEIDIDHMQRQAGMDLSSYDTVRANADRIYFQTSLGKMPKEPGKPWAEARVQTFLNWIDDGYPLGELPFSEQQIALTSEKTKTAVSMRRNASNLSESDVEKVKLAFLTMMARDPADPESYFSLASIHWYPVKEGRTFCVHHEPRYNPWHRVYIDRFEAAMRSVPGCEDIRLPYWDILAPIPDWMGKPPFDSYELPLTVHPNYPRGTKTSRNAPKEIETALTAFNVEGDIRTALNSPEYMRFANFIESAHDSGHVACGDSMDQTDIASFDPLFWFFHCNWERLWWAWQNRYNATDLPSFRGTLSGSGSANWLDSASLNNLRPFDVKTGATINSTGYAYEEIPIKMFDTAASIKSGNVSLERTFSIEPSSMLSLRVKNIARLGIKGSFVVHLFADDEPIAMRGFFQSSSPEDCPNCVNNALIDIDFMINRAAISDKLLQIKIETLEHDRVDRWVSLSQVGNPTVNIRQILVNR